MFRYLERCTNQLWPSGSYECTFGDAFDDLMSPETLGLDSGRKISSLLYMYNPGMT